jgi:hypothetical protein
MVAVTATARLGPQGFRSGGMDRQRSHDTSQFLEHGERSCAQQLLELVRLRVLIAMVLHAAATAASCLYTLFSSRFAGHTVWHCDRARESLLSLLHSGLQQPFVCVLLGLLCKTTFWRLALAKRSPCRVWAPCVACRAGWLRGLLYGKIEIPKSPLYGRRKRTWRSW